MLGNATDKTYSAENTVTAYSRRCIIEWNMNHHYDITAIDDSVYGTTETEFFKRFFPLNEVARGWRPPAGAFRARLGAYRQFNIAWPKTSDRSNLKVACSAPSGYTYTLNPRVYMPLDNSRFKYYESPWTIADAGYIDPEITYTSTNVYANKIVVSFQRATGIPKTYAIQIKNSTPAWVTIGSFTNVSSVASDGSVSLYYDGSSWSTTELTEAQMIPANMINVRGIRVVVTNMGTSANVTLPTNSSFVNVLEMSARAVLSFTDRLNGWSWTATLAEKDTILPIGSISSNEGSVQLSNNDGEIDPTPAATTPSYAYYMRKHGRVQIAYKASTSGSTWVNQLTGYIQSVETTGVYETVSLSIADKLSWTKEIVAHDLLLEKHTPTAVIYTLLDLAGVGPVKIMHDPAESEPKMSFFYSNKEESVFDAIQEVCRAHQYAVSTDENDNIVIYTSSYIHNNRATEYVLTTDNITDGGVDYIPNITQYDDEQTEIINLASVTYNPLLNSSAPDPDQSQFTKSNQVAYSRARTLDLWRPETPLLLGCASLAASLSDSATTVKIVPSSIREARWGNFGGYALIDSEIIKFDGLQFRYQPKGGGASTTKVAKNAEEFAEIVSSASGIVSFTGKLMEVERGQLGTTAAAHNLALTGWTKTPAAKLMKGTGGNGYLHIRSTVNGAKSVAYASKVIDADSRWINTSMTIEKRNTKVKSAGVIISSTVNSNGITGLYIEVSQGTNAKRGTVNVYRVNDSKINNKALATPAIFDMPADKTFDLSIFYKQAKGNKFSLSVYIDSERILRSTIYTTLNLTRRVALATTGDTSARFDYIYGGRGVDGENSQGAVDGALQKYVSDILRRDRGQLPYRDLPNLEAIGFERFDDYVREIFLEDVRFERGPATNVEYILTDTLVRDATNGKNIALGKEIAGSVWGATPFGATVSVANVSSRPLAVAYLDAGGSSVLYPHIFGNIIEEFQSTRYEDKDDSSIFRNGEKKYEFSSRWINNRDSAKKVVKRVLALGKNPRRDVTLSAWSPHVLQVGDAVRVKIPEKGIDSDFVVFSMEKEGKDVVNSTLRLVERDAG